MLSCMSIRPADVVIPEHEIELLAIRAQGAGGQNVNKVSNAVHLRFDIRASSLPEAWKARLLARRDQRISAEGIVVIKAQQHRSLEKNRAEAVERLRELVAAAATVPRPRRATRPTRASQRRRVDEKVKRGQVKALRGKVSD
jgi:ribosome-associated protein